MKTHHQSHKPTTFALFRWMALFNVVFLIGCPEMKRPDDAKQPGQRLTKSTKQKSRTVAQARKLPKRDARPRVIRRKAMVRNRPNPTTNKKPTSRGIRRTRQGKIIMPGKRLSPKHAQMGRRLAAMGAGRRSGNAIRPVYQETGTKPSVLVKQFCDAMYALPSRQKGKCCPSKGFGFLWESQCVRNLKVALEKKAVRLIEAKVKRCVADMKEAHKGCEWIGRWKPLVPRSCQSIFVGTLKVGARCRSSLECKRGLHCYGLGTTRAGRCTEPPTNGVRCGAGVDSLAAFTRQHNLHEIHPLCKTGYCSRYVCRPWKNKGQPCTNDVQCSTGHFCDGKRCLPGKHAKLGATCTGKCPSGARCVKGVCKTIKKTGEVCTLDFECFGGCIKARKKKTGVCGKRCSTLRLKR